jgi:hypothetical protein
VARTLFHCQLTDHRQLIPLRDWEQRLAALPLPRHWLLDLVLRARPDVDCQLA